MKVPIPSSSELESCPEGERTERLRELETYLSEWFVSGISRAEFFSIVRRIADQLRGLDYDLWSYDSDGESFEVLCGNWTGSTRPSKLVVTFRYPKDVEVAWSQPGAEASNQ